MFSQTHGPHGACFSIITLTLSLKKCKHKFSLEDNSLLTLRLMQLQNTANCNTQVNATMLQIYKMDNSDISHGVLYTAVSVIITA